MMNILMMTNTYTPLVGGLEKSVQTFSDEYRRLGHKVLIVAPVYEGSPEDEEDVVRVPAIQKFSGSDFSLQLPVPGILSEVLSRFHPDIVHSHHPFMIGDTALRVAYTHQVPLVYTHHILFEENDNYVRHSEPMKRFVVSLSTGYANLADQVFAPSGSIAELLRQRGVQAPVNVVPTGIDVKHFHRGDGELMRRRLRIPDRAWVVGYAGRLAEEKNLDFLSKAVARFLEKTPDAYFLVVGTGAYAGRVERAFRKGGLGKRLRMAGTLKGQDLIDSYHAMDVFSFASKSETQGLVVTEAMAAGLPVVAIDSPGIRDVVMDRTNGRLLPVQNEATYVSALQFIHSLTREELCDMKQKARRTASLFSMRKSARSALRIYQRLVKQGVTRHDPDNSLWETAKHLIQAEWKLMKTWTKATGAAIRTTKWKRKKPVGIKTLLKNRLLFLSR